MTRPSPTKARSRVVEVLGDSVLHVMGLKESLEQERAALEDQDTDALSDAVLLKSDCVAKLQDLESQRTGLCEGYGFEASPVQMDQLSDWCDEQDEIANCWHHLMQIAAECNALNLTNGAIIRARRQHIDTSLAVLRGTDQDSGTYQRDGAGYAARNQRPLAEA